MSSIAGSVRTASAGGAGMPNSAERASGHPDVDRSGSYALRSDGQRTLADDRSRTGSIFSPVVLLVEAQNLARLSIGHRGL
jgi:hypothetical protein